MIKRISLLVFIVMVLVAHVSFFAGYIAGREHTKHQLHSAFAEGSQGLKQELNRTFWKNFGEAK